MASKTEPRDTQQRCTESTANATELQLNRAAAYLQELALHALKLGLAPSIAAVPNRIPCKERTKERRAAAAHLEVLVLHAFQIQTHIIVPKLALQPLHVRSETGACTVHAGPTR